MDVESRGRMLLEIVAGAVLVILLVLASVMVVSAYKNPETTITNSYNTYTYANPASSYSYPSMMRYSALSTKPYIVDRYYDSYKYDNVKIYYSDRPRNYYIYDDDYDKDYYSGDYDYYDDRDYRDRYDSDYHKKDDRYLSYDDFGNFKTYKGIVGNKVDNYEVYVRNRDYVGGYFKAVFHFEGYYGNVDSESMTHYIPAREEKRFVLKDISPSRYDYRRWWYEVVPLTKVPAKTDYDYDRQYTGTYSGGSQPRTYY